MQTYSDEDVEEEVAVFRDEMISACVHVCCGSFSLHPRPCVNNTGLAQICEIAATLEERFDNHLN
jgi:hypothetical protein